MLHYISGTMIRWQLVASLSLPCSSCNNHAKAALYTTKLQGSRSLDDATDDLLVARIVDVEAGLACKHAEDGACVLLLY